MTDECVCVCENVACVPLSVIYVFTVARSTYSSGSTLCENVRVRFEYFIFFVLKLLFRFIVRRHHNSVPALTQSIIILSRGRTHHWHRFLEEPQFCDRLLTTWNPFPRRNECLEHYRLICLDNKKINELIQFGVVKRQRLKQEKKRERKNKNISISLCCTWNSEINSTKNEFTFTRPLHVGFWWFVAGPDDDDLRESRRWQQ